jgi:hypothetical protein
MCVADQELNDDQSVDNTHWVDNGQYGIAWSMGVDQQKTSGPT